MNVDQPAVGNVETDAERALRESEARLQQVVDNTPSVVFAKDRDGRYMFVNREFERLVERPAAEVIGRTDRELFPPELAARFRQNDLRVLLERRAIEFEETGVFVGETRTFISSKFPLFDADGVPYAICATGTDITERKRVEDALSSAALAVSTAEGETLFTELGRYLATILGVESALIAALRGEGPTGTLHILAFHLDGETRERFEYPLIGTACETVVGQGFRIYPSRLEALFPGDGEFRELGFDSYAGYPLNGADGRPLGVISALSRKPMQRAGFVESVLKIFAVRASAELERVESLAALRASEASYRGIFEASADAIFVHDWDSGAIVDVNPRACEAYGYSYEEMLAARVDTLSAGVPPYTGADAARLIEQAKARGFARFEWQRRNKDGTLHWDEVNLKSATIGGQPRIVAFTREITERKEAEERRARLEAELRRAQKMEAIGQLTGGIAHDFNNILTSVMGYIVLAIERQAASGDERLAAYLDKAHESCDRARRLIEQMLMFSRGQRGAPRPITLAEKVERSLSLLQPVMPATISLETALDRDAPAIMLDPVQLEQVLMNLCINARDALHGAGRIGISVSRTHVSDTLCSACRKPADGAFVELCVEDDGPGIAPEVLERIFEPFYSTKEVGKGTGMGLATLHGIAHEHGGHVIVETAPGNGARFRVLFPTLPHDQPGALRAVAAATATPLPVLALGGSVLVVDDEKTVGQFMRELLRTWGLDATFISDAREAFDLIAQNPARFDLVITDQAMPRMTGVELARALASVRADLPVVLYTGFPDRIEKGELAAADIRGMLAKPVDPQSLAAILISTLGGRPATRHD